MIRIDNRNCVPSLTTVTNHAPRQDAFLCDAQVTPVPSVGDAYDNALAETTVSSFKNEQINRNGPWRDVNHVEVAAFEWVDFFNTERPHDSLGDRTPALVEELHYAHSPPHSSWVRQSESPETPGRLSRQPYCPAGRSDHEGILQIEHVASSKIRKRKVPRNFPRRPSGLADFPQDLLNAALLVS